MTPKPVFSDEMVKKFKELAKQQQEETVIDTNSAIWVYSHLVSLLGRLECAERVVMINSLRSDCKPNESQWKAYLDWLKSCGRDGGSK